MLSSNCHLSNFWELHYDAKPIKTPGNLPITRFDKPNYVSSCTAAHVKGCQKMNIKYFNSFYYLETTP